MFCLAFITFYGRINQKQTKRKLFILIIKFNKKKEFKFHESFYNKKIRALKVFLLEVIIKTRPLLD